MGVVMEAMTSSVDSSPTLLLLLSVPRALDAEVTPGERTMAGGVPSTRVERDTVTLPTTGTRRLSSAKRRSLPPRSLRVVTKTLEISLSSTPKLPLREPRPLELDSLRSMLDALPTEDTRLSSTSRLTVMPDGLLEREPDSPRSSEPRLLLTREPLTPITLPDVLKVKLMLTEELPSETFAPRPITSRKPLLTRHTGEESRELLSTTFARLITPSSTGEDRELLPTRRDNMPSTRLTSGETNSLLPRRPMPLLLLLRRKLMLTTRELLLPELRPKPTEEPLRRDTELLRLPMLSL